MNSNMQNFYSLGMRYETTRERMKTYIHLIKSARAKPQASTSFLYLTDKISLSHPPIGALFNSIRVKWQQRSHVACDIAW